MLLPRENSGLRPIKTVKDNKYGEPYMNISIFSLYFLAHPVVRYDLYGIKIVGLLFKSTSYAGRFYF